MLSRTDPTVESIARYVLDAALDPELPPTQRPARRAGVIRTTSVEKVTTLLVVRFRLELIIPGAKTTITQVAEDAQFLAFTNSGDTLSWLEESAVENLLAARPTGNVADELARTQLDRVLGRLDGTVGHLTNRGEAIAAAAVADHRKVRKSSKTGIKGLRARLLPPRTSSASTSTPDRSAS
ncbi:hypothetical protein ACETU7_23210 [Rhodococcus sp. 3Y1]